MCEASGICRPLALDPVVRVARATWLLPSFARVDPATADVGDFVRLGGDTGNVLYLSFEPLPAGADEATAALVLTLHEPSTHPSDALSLTLDCVRPPGTRGTPAVIVSHAGVRALGRDSRGLVRVDLTELVREASRGGVRALHLALHADGVGSMRIASAAVADPARRPRLEILVP